MEMEDYGGEEFVYESDEWEDGEIDLRDDDEIDREKEKELRMRNQKTIIYLKYVDKHLKGMKKLIKELVDSDEAETIDKSTAARMIDVSSTSRFFSDFMSSETPAETSDSEDEAKESNTDSSDISSRESVSKRVRVNNENEGISEKRRRVDSKYQGESDAPTPEIIPIPRKKYPYIHKVLDSLGIKVENVLHLFQCDPGLKYLQKILEGHLFSIAQRYDFSTQENRKLFMDELNRSMPVDKLLFYQLFNCMPKEELMEHLARILPNSHEMTPEAWRLLIKILKCYRPVPVNLGEKPMDIPDFPLPKMMEQLIDLLPERLEPDPPVNSTRFNLRPEPLHSEGHTAILTLLSIADPVPKNDQPLLPVRIPPTLPEPQNIQATDLELCEPVIRLLMGFAVATRCSKMNVFIHRLNAEVQRNSRKQLMIPRGYADYALQTFVELLIAGSSEIVAEGNSIKLSTFLISLRMGSIHFQRFNNFQSVLMCASVSGNNTKKRLPHDCMYYWFSWCYNFLVSEIRKLS
ncbi:hypothetical protein GCK72_000726 [Caenorhabditis remanei]|uniref:Uncharacterized protein n=1 Tax=Caenorhabditis remanei TaxID=31234 RepID=A0A6A5HRS0_CAERE|nr:hypothetical protein GCK72_000726 [Caenorhabditis remanei]KAF1768913.1 hypothetical protein GCK72_000726 [Caenorhabditis remanei]